MSWFRDLFGFDEYNGNVLANMTYNDGKLRSLVNGQEYAAGKFEIASVGELARRVSSVDDLRDNTFRIVEGDVSLLQASPENRLSVFQTASQFNCLEFINQHITPENGVTGYCRDKTQGPAAAVSCGPGAVVRNYFSFDGKHQTRHSQINTLEKLSEFLGNNPEKYFSVKNGYIFATDEQLDLLNVKLGEHPEEALVDLVSVGILSNTQVTSHTWGTVRVTDSTQLVTQVICSACSVRYNTSRKDKWERFARLILKAQYKAAMLAAILNMQAGGNNKLFLAPLGGSAFGNDPEWIMDAVKYAMSLFPRAGLDICLVAFKDKEKYADKIGYTIETKTYTPTDMKYF